MTRPLPCAPPRPAMAGEASPCRLRTSSIVLALLACLAASPQGRAGDGVETAGDILQYVLPGAAGGLSLGLWDLKGTLQFGESFAATEGATYGLKYAVTERRPNGGSHSFPSAHASVSCCAAEFIRKRYGWALGVPAYALAGFVGYSRVESRAHWPHDVLAGAGIGILSSFIFTRPYKGWRVQVEADGRFFGLSFHKRF